MPRPRPSLRLRARRFTGCVALSCALAACGTSRVPEARLQAEWPAFLGGPDSNQFSPLARIDRTNVGDLVEAWRYEFPENGQSFGNPLVIGRRMYLPWSGGVVALDASNGRELWRVDAPGVRMRGLSHWRDRESGAQRVFYVRDDRLHAIDATDGSTILAFGDAGSIDLKKGLDRDAASIPRIESMSPGMVFHDLIILGSTGGGAWNGQSGVVRAFDVRTGRLEWTFHAIPRPGEPNFGGWPEGAWKTVGGVNNWTGMSLDVETGMLFVPFASAKDNFYGANRAGDNLYANSLVAIDARTGRYAWHFQTVHHDLWDYDLAHAPKLFTLNRHGEQVDAVVIAGKTGFVYAFERRTGRPVFPIEERPVPKSDVPGEHASPTQPFPTAPPPFARQQFTAADLSDYLSAEERDVLRAMIAPLRNEGLFTPPSRRGTVAMPGTSGGANWGNVVADPRNGRLFVAAHEVPSILRLEPASAKEPGRFLTAELPPGAALYTEHCASCHRAGFEGQPPAIPSLVDAAERLEADAVREVVRRGRATMPGIALADEHLDALLTYLGYPESTMSANVSSTDTPRTSESEAPDLASPIAFQSGYNFLFARSGLPASKTPWSTLTAFDMNTGELLWQVPYGELPGLPGSGTIFPRGSIIGTAGNLLIAANQDRKMRVWDMDTGEVILEKPLPSIPNGVPAAYEIDGEQFIAVPAASYDPQIAKLVPAGVMPEGTNALVVYALARDAARSRPD